MKRGILYLSLLSCISWVVFSSVSGGLAAGGQDRTGSPVSTGTCAACHGGGSFGASVTATLKDAGSNPVTSYVPGATYTLEIQVSHSSGSPSGYGAQSVALLAGNVQAGSFTALGSTNQVATLSGREYPEQQGVDADGLFEYTWVAPTGGSGDVVLYTVGNVVSGGGTGGDEVTSTLSVTFTEAAVAACNAPSNLTVTNVNAISADLGFTSGGATMQDVEVVNNGVTPSGVGNATVNNPHKIMGLNENTTYDAYVRDLCESPLMITGTLDGPLSGGTPKCIELYAVDDIADLGIYGLAKVTNGGGSSGAPGTMLPSGSLSAGSYYYVTNDSTGFRNYFGFDADLDWGGLSINGDDAVELYLGGSIIDVFGDVDTDGTGEVWDFMDGWTYRNNNTYAEGTTFTPGNWTFSGINVVDGCSDNGSCGSQWPLGTFTTTTDTSVWVGPVTFTTPACPTVTLNETVVNVSCGGASDGSIKLAPTGGYTPYNYTWSNGLPFDSIGGISGGVHTVTVSSGSCATIGSYTVTEPATLALTVTGADVTCNGANDAMAVAGVTGGTIPYTFIWTFGESTQAVNGATLGFNGVTVTDASGCTASGGVTLTEPSAVTITNTVNTSVTCNGANDGALAVSVAGGASTAYGYAWSSGHTTASLTGIIAGVYDLTVTSAACNEIRSYTVTEPAGFSLSVSVTDATTAGGSDGSATAIVGVTSNYTYQWNNGGQTTPMATGLMAGTVAVTVTSIASGCSQTANGVVSDPGACNITVTATPNATNCNGGSDGSITASAVGGPSSLYTYLWSGSETTQTITGLAANSYSVTVSSGSCTGSASATITEPAMITATDSLGICDGDSILLGGVYHSTAGFYNNTLASVDGCDSVVTVEVTIVTGGANAGNGGELDVCSSDLTANLFSGISGLTDSSGTWSTLLGDEIISPLLLIDDTTEYLYILSSGAGACSVDTAVVSVIRHQAPDAGGDANVSACVSAGDVNLMAELNNPDAGGAWDDVDNTSALTDSLFNATTAGVGNYSVNYILAGNDGCAGDTAFINVDVITAPDAGTGGTLEACDNELTLDLATGLTGTPASGGQWTDDNGNPLPVGSTISPAISGAGSADYHYTVSATGCTDAVATVTVNVVAAPNAGTNGTQTICTTETIDLSTVLGGTPDTGGSWTDDDVTGALSGSTFDATQVAAGDYNFSYSVIGTAPCADETATVTITVDNCTSLDEALKSELVNVYPNPNNGTFNVQINTANQTYNMNVLDITGKAVHSQPVSNERFNVSLNVEAGLYFIQLQSEDGSTVSVHKVTIH